MFKGKQVVVTEKLDGENTTIYDDGTCHARSIDSKHHVSRSLVKALAWCLKGLMPTNWRICGENLYAKHSIYYDQLPSYFMCFAVFDFYNKCLSWEDTVSFAIAYGLDRVPVLYEGVWDVEKIRTLSESKSSYGHELEGYVVRLKDSYDYNDYTNSTAKYVRKNHVQTDDHWMNKPVVPNGRKK